MNESLVDAERAVLAHDQSAEVAEPCDATFDDPALLVAPQHAPVLRRRPVPVGAVRGNQGNAAAAQPFAQCVAVVALVGNHSRRLLSWTPAAVPPPDSDRGQRFFRQPDLAGRCRVKSHSQRNTAAVDHHHPLRPLAPLGFADSAAPFFAGAKLPSKKHSLHFNCWCSFNSARNVRQTRSQMPCSSQSRSRRQHVTAMETRWAGPASEPRFAKSTRCLPAPCGSPPGADPRADVFAVEGAKARSSATARRSAIGWTAASALPLALFPPPRDNQLLQS